MNKILTVALLAGGLLLLDSPEAAAHKEIRHTYQPSAHYRVETRRAKQMPFWLKRDRSFRRWYKHTRLRRNSYLAWHQLFDIYRWERGYVRRHNRSGFGVDIYYREYDRDDRRRHRH